MEIKPIGRYGEPCYPTRNIVDEHPELLRALPKRWQRNAVIGTALLAACGIVAARWQSTPAQAADAPSKVAPIFQHGEGHGSFGCVAVAPPVFLSEDEAREVIVTEAKLAGINFTPDARAIDNLDLPITRLFDFTEEAKTKPKTQRGTLLLDGVDEKTHIAFEYVSEGDFYAWRAQNEDIIATAWSLNLRESATVLRDALAKTQPPGVYGVFYDPAVAEQNRQEEHPGEVLTDRTLVPLSFFEHWGGPGWRFNIQQGRGDIVIITWGDNNSIHLEIGKTKAWFGGSRGELPTPVVLRNRVLYVPLKWAVQTFGGTLEWDERSRLVSVRAPGQDYAQTSAVGQMPIEGMKNPGTVAFSWTDRENSELFTRNIAREELRKQVRDFITWLKAEGVI